MWYIVTLQDFLLQDVVDTQFRWFRVLFNKVHGLFNKRTPTLAQKFLQSQIVLVWECILGRNIALLALL